MTYIGGMVAEGFAGLQASSATRFARLCSCQQGVMPARAHFPGPLKRHTGPQFGPVRGGVLEGIPPDTSYNEGDHGRLSSAPPVKAEESRPHAR